METTFEPWMKLRGPQTPAEAVAFGAWAREEEAQRQAQQRRVKLRPPRPEDGMQVYAPDVLGGEGPALALLVKSIAGEIPGEVGAFPDIARRAELLRRERINMLTRSRVSADALPGEPGFKPTVQPALSEFVRPALYSNTVDCGALLDWVAFHHHHLQAA
jgi:hypothetical protein